MPSGPVQVKPLGPAHGIVFIGLGVKLLSYSLTSGFIGHSIVSYSNVLEFGISVCGSGSSDQISQLLLNLFDHIRCGCRFLDMVDQT